MTPRLNGYKSGAFTPRTTSRTDIHPLRHSYSSGVIKIPTGLEQPAVVGELKVQSHRQVQSARAYKPPPAARPNSPSTVAPRNNTTVTVGQYSVDPINLVTLANSNNNNR